MSLCENAFAGCAAGNMLSNLVCPSVFFAPQSSLHLSGLLQQEVWHGDSLWYSWLSSAPYTLCSVHGYAVNTLNCLQWRMLSVCHAISQRLHLPFIQVSLPTLESINCWTLTCILYTSDPGVSLCVHQHAWILQSPYQWISWVDLQHFSALLDFGRGSHWLHSPSDISIS